MSHPKKTAKDKKQAELLARKLERAPDWLTQKDISPEALRKQKARAQQRMKELEERLNRDKAK